MTTNRERTATILNTREFLTRLMRPPSDGGYARIPREIRKLAGGLLKHYPGEVEMEEPARWLSSARAQSSTDEKRDGNT